MALINILSYLKQCHHCFLYVKRNLIEFAFVSFQGDNVDCWMEIQQGKGPWASPVNGIVPLGTTLTMVVGIDDKEGKIKVLQFYSLKVLQFYSFKVL